MFKTEISACTSVLSSFLNGTHAALPTSSYPSYFWRVVCPPTIYLIPYFQLRFFFDETFPIPLHMTLLYHMSLSLPSANRTKDACSTGRARPNKLDRTEYTTVGRTTRALKGLVNKLTAFESIALTPYPDSASAVATPHYYP